MKRIQKLSLCLMLSFYSISSGALDLNFGLGIGSNYAIMGPQLSVDHEAHRMRVAVCIIPIIGVTGGYDYMFGKNYSFGLTAGAFYHGTRYRGIDLTYHNTGSFAKGWSVGSSIGVVSDSDEDDREDRPVLLASIGYTF